MINKLLSYVQGTLHYDNKVHETSKRMKFKQFALCLHQSNRSSENQ